MNDTPIRVMLLTNAITPDRIGGLERYVRELAGALAHAGADVMLLARRVSDEDPLSELVGPNLTIARYHTPAKTNPGYALVYPMAAIRAARAAIAQERGRRIVHTHFPLPALPAAATRVRYIHTFHAPIHREILAEHGNRYFLPNVARRPLRRVARAAESFVVRRPTSVVTLSRFMAQEARALGASAEKLVWIPGGIDTKRFAPGAPIPGRRLPRGDGPLLFTARRLVPRTGVLSLVQAMSEIRRTISDARLIIAGRGPLEPEIRAAIAALDLHEHVELLGWVSEDDLVGWLRAVHLVVVPTQELEGFGLATAEALACGTPVVGTTAGATPELLEQLDPSLLTDGVTPAAIAATIVDHLNKPERLQQIAARARAVVHPAMSWPNVAQRHLELYQSLSASSMTPSISRADRVQL